MLISRDRLQALAGGDAETLEALQRAVDEENMLCAGAAVVTAGALALDVGASVLPLCASHILRLRRGSPHEHQARIWPRLDQAVRAFADAPRDEAVRAIGIALEQAVRDHGHRISGVPSANILETVVELVQVVAQRWAVGHDPSSCHCEGCADCTEVAEDLVAQSESRARVQARAAALLSQCRAYVRFALEIRPEGRMQ